MQMQFGSGSVLKRIESSAIRGREIEIPAPVIKGFGNTVENSSKAMFHLMIGITSMVMNLVADFLV